LEETGSMWFDITIVAIGIATVRGPTVNTST
jgi:hypothetical protein